MKTVLKFAALVFVVTIAFMIVSALVPYSEGLRTALETANETADGSVLLFLLLNKAWLCLAIWYVVVKSPWEKHRLALSLIGVLFLVSSFMTQIETFFFHTAFPALTSADIFWICLTYGVPIFAGVPLALYLFKKKNATQNTARNISLPPLPELAAKLTIIGLAYLFIYFLFGHFVAWQEEDLRVFYSGSAENIGFFPQLMYNMEENPAIFPFQFFRGVLFGVIILPLVLMFQKNPKVLFLSLLLVFLSTGIPLLIPNPLFPDSVRWAHFQEMISSMFVFTIIVWYIYTKVNFNVRRTKLYKKISRLKSASHQVHEVIITCSHPKPKG